jgi:hypothetical protein
VTGNADLDLRNEAEIDKAHLVNNTGFLSHCWPIYNRRTGIAWKSYGAFPQHRNIAQNVPFEIAPGVNSCLPQGPRPATKGDLRVEPRIICVFDQPGGLPGFLCAGQRDPPNTLWQIFRKCGCQSGVRCRPARYNRNARGVDPVLLRTGFSGVAAPGAEASQGTQ